MEWEPNHQGLQELVNIFKESLGCNNQKHKEICEKLNIYSKNPGFSNYLVHILNNEDLEDGVRQISGLTLKGIMERQFQELNEEDRQFFKKNILKCYLHKKAAIRKTISNLINTFLRVGGLQMWQEILEILFEFLNNDVGVAMSLETLIIVIEDFGNYINKLLEKLTNFLFNVNENIDKGNSKDLSLIKLVLKTLNILLENCSSCVIEQQTSEIISKSLICISQTKHTPIRTAVTRCFFVLIKLKTDIFSNLQESILNFLNANLSVGMDNYNYDYDLTFISAEFYLYILEEETPTLVLESSSLKSLIFGQFLKNLLIYFFTFSKLTNNDICGEEMENRDYIGHQDKFEEEFEKAEDLDIEYSSTKNRINSDTSTKRSERDIDDIDSDEQIFEEDIETYNKIWSLRKCSSKILEKFSVLWPNETLVYIQPFLEIEIQHKDWIIRERSILVLGTVGQGTYQFLKPNLQNLITYLLGEISNSNKLIRAITCWTLSRFSDYIVSDPQDTLLKVYLIELLKRFLDPETIVQEAACSAFNILVTGYKDKLLPYLSDVFKIITNTFGSFKGEGLLTLYDSIILLTENYPDSFRELDLVCELVYRLLTKWCEFILNIKQLNEKGEKLVLDVTNINFIDLSMSLIKVSSDILFCHFEDYFSGAIMIMQLYAEDKDVICRCLDLISQLIQNLSYQFCKSPNVPTLMKIISDLFIYDKDLGIKQYAIALIGDISKTESGKVLLEEHIDSIIHILIESLMLKPIKDTKKYQVNQISVCNNSCWTLGLICKIFPEKINVYITSLMSRIINIFALPKLNKSLAQNTAILLGRVSMVNSREISQYLDQIIKQFCLSIKFVPDGVEKQDAFIGICGAIIINPLGPLKYFAFFCDSVCNYNDAPPNIENLLQNIISSYKELLANRWYEYFTSFPEKLRTKMKDRFTFLNR